MRFQTACSFGMRLVSAWVMGCIAGVVHAGGAAEQLMAGLDQLPPAIEYTVDRKSTVTDAWVAKYNDPRREHESQFSFLASGERWRYEMRYLAGDAFKTQWVHAFDGETYRQLTERLHLWISKKPGYSYDYARVFNGPLIPFKFLMEDQSLEDSGGVPGPDWRSLRDPLRWSKFISEATENRAFGSDNDKLVLQTKDHTDREHAVSHYVVVFRKDRGYIPVSITQVSSSGVKLEEITVDEIGEYERNGGGKFAFPKQLTEKLYQKNGDLLITSRLKLRDVRVPEAVEKGAFDINYSLARGLTDVDNNVTIPLTHGK